MSRTSEPWTVWEGPHVSMPQRVRLGQERGQVTRAMDGQHGSEGSLFIPRAGA